MRIRQFLILACLLLLFSAAPRGHGDASIQGIISDPSGAVIPGVTVTITNQETGVSRSLQTDERGFYLVPNLPSGRYRVDAERLALSTPSGKIFASQWDKKPSSASAAP
ncbi:MAG: carboxypeptidase regulatory-like domain-containing protein [Acidobacteria bacterium]|nr:carboxypeptidase regulatory-like domain-containing protein [Acidobacteriota bacterium]